MKPNDPVFFSIFAISWLAALAYGLSFSSLLKTIRTTYPEIANRFPNAKTLFQSKHLISKEEQKDLGKVAKFFWSSEALQLAHQHRLQIWILRVSLILAIGGFVSTITLGVIWGKQGLITLGGRK